ncbi:hypothetical protein WKI68_42115 [Streptomyces sp. MS1.HAVA.3]|uniref:Uncharacterized protein n=1 Tax=Streptomyces caledonius TaxID=3134107 RepID=A0ABU8UDS2_9ACTN
MPEGGGVREGEHWARALESVAVCWPAAWWEDLGDVARARIGGEEDLLWSFEPWSRFGIEVPGRRSPPRPSLDGLSDEELLALLAADATQSDTNSDTRSDALRALAGREPAEGLLPLVPSLGTGSDRRPLPFLRRAVGRLGALAVPAARGWAVDEREWLARLGTDVLADHPDPAALPGLVAELADQWEARNWCGPDETAKRLARFGPEAADAVPRPVGLLAAHPALVRTGRLPAGARRNRPDRAGRRVHRIAVLRDDLMEIPEVRAAAGVRLAATTGPGSR